MPIARASMSVLPGARARRVASLACAPLTPLSCATVYFFLHCMMHHAVLGCCTKHMQQPPPSLFPLPLQHRKPRLCQALLVLSSIFFNFYASSRLKLPTLGPFSPFFASGVDSRPKKWNFCLDSRPEGLGSGDAHTPLKVQ